MSDDEPRQEDDLDLEESEQEAIERAVDAEATAERLNFLAWGLAILCASVGVLYLIAIADGEEPASVDGAFTVLGLSAISAALSFSTMKYLSHMLAMTATSLKLQVDAMPE